MKATLFSTPHKTAAGRSWQQLDTDVTPVSILILSSLLFFFLFDAPDIEQQSGVPAPRGAGRWEVKEWGIHSDVSICRQDVTNSLVCKSNGVQQQREKFAGTDASGVLHHTRYESTSRRRGSDGWGRWIRSKTLTTVWRGLSSRRNYLLPVDIQTPPPPHHHCRRQEKEVLSLELLQPCDQSLLKLSFCCCYLKLKLTMSLICTSRGNQEKNFPSHLWETSK